MTRHNALIILSFLLTCLTAQAGSKVKFTYCGTDMSVRFTQQQRFHLDSVSENLVSDVWNKLPSSAYSNTLKDCLALKEKHRLNDWGYLCMLHEMSKACLGETNEATLLKAFLFVQSGLATRLGRTEDGRLMMLFATDYTIYEMPYFLMDNVNYYPHPMDSALTYQLKLNKTGFSGTRPISLELKQQPLLTVKKSEPITHKARDYENLAITSWVNINLLAFYNSYPTSYKNIDIMTRWALLGNTPLADEVKKQIYPQLRKRLKGKSQLEAVKMLLNLMQTGFDYKYDDEVWGYDRAFFAEETLFYPYCDVEDRCILFAHFVRDLLDLPVILIFFPGHLAAGVCLDEEVAGDFYIYNGEKFTICDCVYIGAKPGMSIPSIDTSDPKFILLK